MHHKIGGLIRSFRWRAPQFSYRPNEFSKRPLRELPMIKMASDLLNTQTLRPLEATVDKEGNRRGLFSCADFIELLK
jgi:hypothetical protein